MNYSSFGVCINEPGKQSVVLLGVTSIVPNMGGVLFFTEDGQNYQLESYQKFAGHDGVTYTIEYFDDGIPDADELVFIDHRAH